MNAVHKTILWSCAIGLSLGLSLSNAATDAKKKPAKLDKSAKPAYQTAQTDQADQTAKPKARKSRRYQPPKNLGAPASDRRIGGGTRGPSNGPLTIAVLAPNAVGHTVNDKPTLYWYLSKTTKHPIELTVSPARAIKPLLEVQLSAPDQPGIQRVSLADHQVKLDKGVRYNWSVVVVRDHENRSQDVIATGMIQVVDSPQDLSSRLQQAHKKRAPYIYSEAQMWYDAMTAVADLLEAAPNDTELKQHRVALLKEVQLDQVVAVE